MSSSIPLAVTINIKLNKKASNYCPGLSACLLEPVFTSPLTTCPPLSLTPIVCDLCSNLCIHFRSQTCNAIRCNIQVPFYVIFYRSVFISYFQRKKNCRNKSSYAKATTRSISYSGARILWIIQAKTTDTSYLFIILNKTVLFSLSLIHLSRSDLLFQGFRQSCRLNDFLYFFSLIFFVSLSLPPLSVISVEYLVFSLLEPI